MPLLLLFALFMLLRGHNLPGGGFIGGLVFSAAFALHTFAFGAAAARRALLVDPSIWIGAGLLLALCCGLIPLLMGKPFLSAVWFAPDFGLGTPLLFDLGVFLDVIGVVLTITFTLAEE
jgi:multicomponent Na+:H+ antiporter subunit B